MASGLDWTECTRNIQTQKRQELETMWLSLSNCPVLLCSLASGPVLEGLLVQLPL